MNSGSTGMNRIFATVLAGALAGVVAGCGGGGSGGIVRPTPPVTPPVVTPPTPTRTYGGVAAGWVTGGNCSAVGAIVTDYAFASSAEAAALGLCQSAGASCTSSSFGGCAAVAAGVEAQADASGIRDCNMVTRGANSVSLARSDALQACRNLLGSGARCDVVSSGCASYSVSPGVGRWSAPSTTPTPTPTNPLRDVNVTIPSSCPREIQLCVWDWACEDNDRMRISVNGNTVFSGTIYNEEQCRVVPVREGRNSIELYAFNVGDDTCGQTPAENYNSARLRIRGGTDARTQTVEGPGQAGSSANLNITIGPAGGSCTPGGTTQPPTQSRLYGAVATHLASQCAGHYGGIAANYSSEPAAHSAAIAGCRSAGGGSGCSVNREFGSAYSGNNACGALAYGERPTGNGGKQCRQATGTGGTESAAESAALTNCRSGGFSCHEIFRWTAVFCLFMLEPWHSPRSSAHCGTRRRFPG